MSGEHNEERATLIAVNEGPSRVRYLGYIRLHNIGAQVVQATLKFTLISIPPKVVNSLTLGICE